MKFILSVLFVSVLSLSAKANDAGCGLGDIIWRDNSKLIQLFAVTTNQTLFSQVLGITFGTSHCTASGIALKEKEQIYYVELNLDILKEEMAQGRGEHLDAFAGLLGCTPKDFADLSKENYSRISPSGTQAIDFLWNTKQIMRSNFEMARTCRHLG